MVKFENNENENDNEKTDNVVEDPDPYFVPIVSLPEVEVSKLLEFNFNIFFLLTLSSQKVNKALKSIPRKNAMWDKGLFFKLP